MAEERISISRDALRAELAELELRLIQKLAARTDLEALQKRVITLEERTQGLKDRKLLTTDDVDKAISDALHNREARGWTARERWFGAILFAISVATFAIQLRGI